MRNLNEADVLRIMREEWDKRVESLTEEIDLVMDANPDGDGKEPVISSDLKVKHKKSGIRYTIDSVGPNDIVLRTPEGKDFLIDKAELEKDYELA